MAHQHDVVVVGAGPSGLAAATTLVSGGLDVVVLEARDRVGGRTWTVDVDGSPVDLGGQWVGPTQHHLLDVIAHLGLSTSPTPTTGASMLVLQDRTVSYRGTIPRLSVLSLVQLQRALWDIDRQARRVDSATVRSAREAQLDGMSLAEWMRARHVRPDVESVVRTAMRIVFGHEAEAIPFLRFLQYVRAAGGVMPLVDTAGGAQDARIVGGAQQVSEGLAGPLGDRVRLGTPVTGVRVGDGVDVVTASGSVAARHLVMAVPPRLAAELDWAPGLSPVRQRWLASHEMGTTLKTQILYDRPFWRDADRSGEVVWADGDLDVAFDNSQDDGRAGLVVFATGDRGRRLGRLAPDARRRTVLANLVDALGDDAGHPEAYIDHDWDTEPLSGGCPVATPTLGAPVAGFDPTIPDGPVHWAGTETSTVWRGYIDGAIAAGRRAATDILAGVA